MNRFKKSLLTVILLAVFLPLLSSGILAENYEDYQGKISYDSSGPSLAMIDSDNNLYMKGKNKGQILGSEEENVTEPVLVMRDVVKVSTDWSSVAVIKTDGSLWTWGANNWGNCGNGIDNGLSVDEKTRNTPVKILDDVLDVKLTGEDGGALRKDHSLWLWGRNNYGQFGTGKETSSFTPVKVKDDIKDFEINTGCTTILNEIGDVLIAGNNKSGSIGNGKKEDVNYTTFQKVLDHVKQIKSSNKKQVALLDNGDVYYWGTNDLVVPTKVISGVRNIFGTDGAVLNNNQFYHIGPTEVECYLLNKPYTPVYGISWSEVIGGDGKIYDYYGDTEIITSAGTKVPLSSLGFTKDNIQMKPGEKRSLLMVPSPASGDLSGMKWESDSGCVSVESGEVTAVSKGSAVITATANNQVQGKVRIDVNDSGTPVTEVILGTDNLTLKTGQSYLMNSSVKPDSASDKTLIWESSKDSVAHVSGGKITAGSSGTAVITAKAVSGAKAECTVVVRNTDKTPAQIPEASTVITPTTTNNLNKQNYQTYGDVISSYLVKENNGYMRVEDLKRTLDYNNPNLKVSYFNNNYQCTGEKTIPYELPLFGGFYNGDNFYYLVFGQDNPREDDNAEVIRIVKYDKNWNKLNSLTLTGMNTKKPFDAGSLRFAQSGDLLYIRTCHTMYKTDDGFNHQSNMTIEVNIPDLSLIQAYYDIMNPSVGYVSHSFNQFIIVDGNSLVGLDHGDGWPRGACICSYYKGVDATGFLPSIVYNGCCSASVKGFKGDFDRNYTGASLGGFEASKNNYLVAGNTIDQNNFDNSTVNNIFLTVSLKSDFDGKHEKITLKEIPVTSYPESGTVSASTPHLVKFNDNRFLLIWALHKKGDYKPNGTISYVYVDGDGNLLGDVQTTDGYLSDCKPIVDNGAAEWYVTDGQNNTLYRLEDSKFTSTSIKTKEDKPVDPIEPDEPAIPDKPITDDNPDSPETPDVPDTPDTPENPDGEEISFKIYYKGVPLKDYPEINHFYVKPDGGINLTYSLNPSDAYVGAYYMDGNSSHSYVSININQAKKIMWCKGNTVAGNDDVLDIMAFKNGKRVSYRVQFHFVDSGDNEPEITDDPTSPEDPGQPSDPENPNEPSDPEPDKPDSPDTPSKPDTPVQPDNPEQGRMVVTRLYNEISGEHLYTTDSNEVSVLTQGDWKNEGTGWTAPTTGEAVFRLYSDVTHEHLYTTDTNEVNTLAASGIWSVDNNREPLFYSGGSKPIYRLYNEGILKHHLTADANENNVLGAYGWNQEGIKLYCLY